MSDQYIGEIRMFGGNFAPEGWLPCDGRLLPISDYETLFTLVGAQYGGDGSTNFALPDLRGRVPVHQGQPPQRPPFALAQQGGAETVTLTTGQIPAHQHAMQASTGVGTSSTPTNNLWAQTPAHLYTTATTPAATMDPSVIGPAGQNQAHDNMLPYLSINFIIAYQGLFPQQS